MKCRSQVNVSNKYGETITPSDLLKLRSDLIEIVPEGSLPLLPDLNLKNLWPSELGGGRCFKE